MKQNDDEFVHGYDRANQFGDFYRFRDPFKKFKDMLVAAIPNATQRFTMLTSVFLTSVSIDNPEIVKHKYVS